MNYVLLLRTNSSERSFDENIRQFKSRLQVRGYPDTPVNKVLSEVKSEERKSTLQQKEKKDTKILPFVTQYHQAVPNLEKILSSKWHLIQSQSLPREMQRASHYLVQKRSFAQRYTRSIQTLGAKTGVVQACHNFFNF